MHPNSGEVLAHELAHVVDQRTGAAGGLPILQRQDYDEDRAERAREKAAVQQRKQERASTGRDLDQLAGAEAERDLRALENDYRQAGAQQRSVERKAADLERYRKLLTRIPGTPLDKSKRQGAFDELQRTPTTTAGKPQDKYVAGGPALTGQELRPGRDKYAQPDYSMHRRDAQGNLVRIHVNLKSDDIDKLTPAQARGRGVAYYNQAVRNRAQLPAGEDIVISFAQTPSKDIQEAINEQLFREGSPVKEVRYGTTTHRPPANLSSRGTSAPAPRPASTTATSAPRARQRSGPSNLTAVKVARTSSTGGRVGKAGVSRLRSQRSGRGGGLVGLLVVLGASLIASEAAAAADDSRHQGELKALEPQLEAKLVALTETVATMQVLAPGKTVYVNITLQIATFEQFIATPDGAIENDLHMGTTLGDVAVSHSDLRTSRHERDGSASRGGTDDIEFLTYSEALESMRVEELIDHARLRSLDLNPLRRYVADQALLEESRARDATVSPQSQVNRDRWLRALEQIDAP